MHQRIGILGGTFNPIHFGHLASAEEVRERLQLDRVLFIPSFLPPHKHEKEMPSPVQRLAMVHLAISGNPRFVVSDIEVKRGGTSYTIDTILLLKTEYPEADLFFITGLDSFLEIKTWHQWQSLLSQCMFVVLSRPGYRFLDLLKIDFMQHTRNDLLALDRREVAQVEIRSGDFAFYLETIPLYDISSTDIRKRVHDGRSIKYLLPESVEHYIIDNRLYA